MASSCQGTPRSHVAAAVEALETPKAKITCDIDQAVQALTPSHSTFTLLFECSLSACLQLVSISLSFSRATNKTSLWCDTLASHKLDYWAYQRALSFVEVLKTVQLPRNKTLGYSLYTGYVVVVSASQPATKTGWRRLTPLM